MDLDIREWMLLAGGILFVTVVIDGVRRVLADRKEEVRLSKRAKKGFPPLGDENEAPKSSELLSPARVMARAEAQQRSKDNDERLEQDVPVLLDTVDEDEIDHLEGAVDAPESSASEPFVRPEQESLGLADIEDEPTPNLGDIVATETVEAAADDEPLGEADQVIVINVHAQKGEVFNGKEMLETLLNHDVRFGSMDIFHRRETLSDSKRVQFSIANSVEPGTFLLDEFETFSTPGVTFFLQLPGPKKPMDAFKAMLSATNALASAVGGLMLDEQRNPISQQTLEHMKQQVEDFERRSLVKRN